MPCYKTLSCVCVFLWMFSVQHAFALGVNPQSKRALRKSLKNYSTSRSKAGSFTTQGRGRTGAKAGRKGTARSHAGGKGKSREEKNKIIYTLPEPKKFSPATMVDVEDGDTIHVLWNDAPFTVSLYGIDSPERTQPHGIQAMQVLKRLLRRKNIKLQVYDTDRKKRRCLAVVSVGKTNVNKLLVRGGHAWVRQKYCSASFCTDWLSSQQKAKAAKKGLWSYPVPIAPWVWRAMPKERRHILQRGYSPVDNGLRSRYGKDTTIIGR